ncbi:MAG: SRPBCC family protein [Acidobacteria bacterium]|jgi:carbon monoxide dehydrogenase subunit G|nr:SRPBCC family protein [Acidobacteriota bacterium]
MGQTYQSIVINAPVDDVWNRLKDFHDLSWAPNVITSVDKVGDKNGTDIGAKRILNGAFHETLLELHDDSHTQVYSIDDGPPPVSKADVVNYVGRVECHAETEGGGTFVAWSSKWDNADGGAADFCHNVCVALLGDLKKSLEP